MSLMYSASEHVSTRTHKCAWRLSSAFAHSRRPRARPSCFRAFFITCYTMGRAHRQPRRRRCEKPPTSREATSRRERSANLQRVFYTHFTLWSLSNDLLLSSRVNLNVISSVGHPTKSVSSRPLIEQQTTQTHFFGVQFLQRYRCRLPLSSM